METEPPRCDLGTFFEAHYEELVSFASSRLWGPLRALVTPNEVVHEAWLRARERPFHGPPGAFRAWMARRILFEILGLFRSSGLSARGPPPPRAADPALLDQLRGDHTQIEEALRASEELVALRSALSRLTHLQQEVLRMEFFEGRAPAEIARALGTSSSAVCHCRHRPSNA